MNKITLPLALMIMLIMLPACGKKKTGLEQSSKIQTSTASGEKTIQTPASQPENTSSPVDPSLSPRAKILKEMFKPGKYTYVLFYDKSNQNSVYMSKIIDLAVPELKPRANVFKIDREDPSNEEVLKVFRGANKFKVPMTVLYMPDRYPIRRFSSLVSAEALVKAIPSPTQEKVIHAYRRKKIGVICFYKESMKDFPEVDKTCKEAVQRLQGLAHYFLIHMEDPQEQHFMWKMNVDKEEIVPTVVIVNEFGKGDRRFKGTFSVQDLVTGINQEHSNPTR